MIVFRLSKAAFAIDLSGKGAEKGGGRWNSKGTAMVYTSESRALCTTEIAVHTPLGNLPLGYQITSIEIPDNVPIQSIPDSCLPHDWNSIPHSHSTQLIGDRFIAERIHAVIKVPSAVVQGEFNYLINPSLVSENAIKVVHTETFSFDERLFKR